MSLSAVPGRIRKLQVVSRSSSWGWCGHPSERRLWMPSQFLACAPEPSSTRTSLASSG